MVSSVVRPGLGFTLPFVLVSHTHSLVSILFFVGATTADRRIACALWYQQTNGDAFRARIFFMRRRRNVSFPRVSPQQQRWRVGSVPCLLEARTLSSLQLLYLVQLSRLVKRLFRASSSLSNPNTFDKTLMFRKFLLGSTASACAAAAGVAAVAHLDEDEAVRQAEAILPRAYAPEPFEKFWGGQHRCVAARRVFEIAGTLIPFAGRAVWHYNVTNRNGDAWDEHVQAQWGVELRETLTKLGPTFIKAGQAISIRPDLLPTPILVELQKLCDEVPAFPTARAKALLESELGGPAEQFFEAPFPSSPIAAASLGQVYKCRLLKPIGAHAAGSEVALKIQRPDMIACVSRDLYIMRKYTQFIERFKQMLMSTGVLGSRKQFDVALLDTFARASYFELDYEHEASNQERFAKELRGLDRVYVPYVHRVDAQDRRTTTRRVLTTEWIDGVQLAQSSPEVINKLIGPGVECFLEQLLRFGFFHCDPHPGNLLVDGQGRLVLIDFGLCAEVEQPDTKGMTSAIVHLMEGDVSELIKDAVNLRFLPEDVEQDKLLPALQEIFDDANLAAESMQRDGESFGGGDVLSPPSRSGLSFDFKTQERRQQFKHISRKLNSVFYRFPFAVPEYFALITRALIVLEGIALTGDPTFDIFSASYPYASEHAVEVFGYTGLAKMGAAALLAERRKKEKR